MMEAEVRKRKRERDGSQESDEPRDVGGKSFLEAGNGKEHILP